MSTVIQTGSRLGEAREALGSFASGAAFEPGEAAAPTRVRCWHATVR